MDQMLGIVLAVLIISVLAPMLFLKVVRLVAILAECLERWDLYGKMISWQVRWLRRLTAKLEWRVRISEQEGREDKAAMWRRQLQMLLNRQAELEQDIDYRREMEKQKEHTENRH